MNIIIDMPLSHPLSQKARIALIAFAKMIKSARLSANMSQQELALRLKVSRLTISAIEKGAPTVGIGIFFEAALIVGIPLLAEDLAQLNIHTATLSATLSLLPARAGRKTKRIDDDF